MRQLALNWGPTRPPTLDTFVAGQNHELAARLRQFAERSSNEPCAYLWGPPGAGKSHLLQALGATAGGRYIGRNAEPSALLYSPQIDLYLLDDCDHLPPATQIQAFNLFNQVRENQACMVSAGALPPARLALREDLRTRLGWGLVYQLHGLSDQEKIAALEQLVQRRGLTLSAGVLPYLMSHFERDMRSLSALLDALDLYSLETRRPITLPLLRSLLQQEGELKT